MGTGMHTEGVGPKGVERQVFPQEDPVPLPAWPYFGATHWGISLEVSCPGGKP